MHLVNATGSVFEIPTFVRNFVCLFQKVDPPGDHDLNFDELSTGRKFLWTLYGVVRIVTTPHVEFEPTFFICTVLGTKYVKGSKEVQSGSCGLNFVFETSLTHSHSYGCNL